MATSPANSLRSIYKGRRVLVTGHTGFKGSWLMRWLEKLGAEATGFSLPAPSEPSHFELLKMGSASVIGDIRDQSALDKAFAQARPEVVFHMAAQPIVRRSYREPVETYETNVIGTLKVFEACRKTASVRAVVNITSDKCYENREWVWPYRETDPMGGHDPYSSSKGCAEILASSYQRSYFPAHSYGKDHDVLLASARAGNVIGGGDWAEDRLLPDAIRAAASGRPLEIRNPAAVRPWQHVLEPLAGYLQLGERLLGGDASMAEGWNFGPDQENCVTVGEIIEAMRAEWDAIKPVPGASPLHEAHFLRLDSTKARARLAWRPRLGLKETVRWTGAWYKAFYQNGRLDTDSQIDSYMDLMGAGPAGGGVS